VAIELVEDVQVGDRLLCHAGAALEKLPSTEGQPTALAQSNDAEDPAAFLYPFLDREETDLESVLRDIETSTLGKADDVIELRRQIDLAEVNRCAKSIRHRLQSGGSLVTFGNGGSSTDAQDLVADALEQGWDAVCLNNDVATVTAIGNDVGFDKAFSRQLIPLGGAQDIAVAISTSGNSDNLIAGLDEARRHQMLTVGIAGYDGGRMAELGWIDHLFVVPSDYIPRIQEAQATIYHLLLDLIGVRQ
jgi:D-sedoheptulose 7-phosphate isomerase